MLDLTVSVVVLDIYIKARLVVVVLDLTVRCSSAQYFIEARFNVFRCESFSIY